MLLWFCSWWTGLGEGHVEALTEGNKNGYNIVVELDSVDKLGGCDGLHR